MQPLFKARFCSQYHPSQYYYAIMSSAVQDLCICYQNSFIELAPEAHQLAINHNLKCPLTGILGWAASVHCLTEECQSTLVFCCDSYSWKKDER